VRENIKVRRAYIMTASGAGEVLGHYVHGAVASGAAAGRQAGLVRVSSRDGGDVSVEKARGVANKVAMHAVAVAPRFLDPEGIPEDVVAGEMAILHAQIEGSGKPANVVEKIVVGKMRKFHEETCLTKQKFVMDDSMTVEKFVDGEVNGLVVSRFARLKVGEGIEVQAKDFAAEVAATVADTAA
jgi:elongation factor Ts